MSVCKAKKNLFSTYRISYISLITNKNKEISGGKCDGESMTFDAPEGYAISGFIGYASNEIDRLGCIYQKL